MSTSDANASRKADLAATVASLEGISQQLAEKRLSYQSARDRASSNSGAYDCATMVSFATGFADAAQGHLDSGDLDTCAVMLSWGQAWAMAAEDCFAEG